jgi:hypothetical protein
VKAAPAAERSLIAVDPGFPDDPGVLNDVHRLFVNIFGPFRA